MSQILSELFVSGLITIWVLVIFTNFCLEICNFSSSNFGTLMASSSGTTTSSGGSYLHEEIDDRKKRRMVSNRESARRSRMRKQKHLDDLMTQLSQLRKENNQIISSISMTTQHYMTVEAENSVLGAQVAELSHRLQSLNEIITFMKQPIDTGIGCGFDEDQYDGSGSGSGSGAGGSEFGDEFMYNSLSHLYACQPILASADMIMY
ncbi:Basic-leucine zipper domain-containing protein [Cynara cardunculus var. scolymus]|uniref:Basic-leucine zipper domain-containing protein n=2 Tax=Cynara cardunculus var. scolymus TaxID=59895 RepID=A0A103YKD6_CYNCS|nr:Basic-leucine zipper domain-containing protein [Cynara cardunculus var. scolymus]